MLHSDSIVSFFCLIKMLIKCGFIDITNNRYKINATLPSFSFIRPFQEEKVRYIGITGLTPNLIFKDGVEPYPINILCEKTEIIKA